MMQKLGGGKRKQGRAAIIQFWFFSLILTFGLVWGAGVIGSENKMKQTAERCEQHGFFVFNATVYNCEKAKGGVTLVAGVDVQADGVQVDVFTHGAEKSKGGV